MNFTVNRTNPKEPENANPFPPHIVNQYSSNKDDDNISKALTDLITQTVDPDVLEKIRELDNSSTFTPPTNSFKQAIPNAKSLPINPLRDKTGLLYRDILRNTDNVRKLGDDANRSVRHK